MIPSVCASKGCPYYRAKHFGYYKGQFIQIDATCRMLDRFIKVLSKCPKEK